MKVIKAASLEWSSAETCEHCGSELEVELGDLKRVSGSDQRDNSTWDYAEFVCPVCGRGQRLKRYDAMPEHIRARIGRAP